MIRGGIKSFGSGVEKESARKDNLFIAAFIVMIVAAGILASYLCGP